MKLRVAKFGGREYELREIRLVMTERYTDNLPMIVILPPSIADRVFDYFFTGKEMIKAEEK